MSEYGEVKDIEDMVTLYSNLMMESFNAGITEALVIREEADRVKEQIKSEVRELVAVNRMLRRAQYNKGE